jgi:hypothetical protein
MTKPTAPSESTLFNQLFGSKNFIMGGIGRTDCSTALRSTTEERLIEAARERNAHVIQLGTDYVVVLAGAGSRNVYSHPTPSGSSM